ncbi:MAG: hypothetical protein EOM30_11770 [Clostridia bacterium]|nr:hypothetical protein [Clostridia bacterium]NLS85734.1 hypothetical protein [Oscillospiraceae bacterium]
MPIKNKKPHHLVRFCVFVAICLVLAAPMLLSGELLRTKQVVALQPYLGDKFLYGASYSNTYSLYKYSVLTQRKAPVLAVGDSRVLQFKAEFFNNKQDFYNSGMLFVTPRACLTSLQNMPADALPKVLIYGIDQSALTKANCYNSPFDVPEFMRDEIYATPSALLKAMSIDIGKGDYNIFDTLAPFSKIGMTAKNDGSGFMQDGSYYYGKIYHSGKTAAERIAKDLDRIKKGEDWFAGSKEIYQDSIDVFGQIADFCSEKGIKLVAFMPPFSPTGYEAYHNRKDTKFLDDIDTKLAPIFTSRGAEFYNFTDPATLALTDEEFIDAFHGSDVAYLRILQAMLNGGSCLNDYINNDALAAMDASRVSGLILREGL